MDSIEKIKEILRLIRDRSEEKRKEKRSRAFNWFMFLIEDFSNKLNEIKIRHKNKLSFEHEYAELIEKTEGLEEITDAFLNELPMPPIRSKIEDIKKIIKTIIVVLKDKKVKETEQLQNVLKIKLDEFLAELEKICATMMQPQAVKFYGCNKAVTGPCFIEQRDKGKLEDKDAVVDAIEAIKDFVMAGLKPTQKEPRFYGGGLYGKVIGDVKRIIFYEKEHRKEIVLCVYIDAKTHNDAVNKNVNNTYRKIISNEITKENYFSHREIDPDTLEDI